MRVTSKGQVTIPQKIREKTGFPPGSEVTFEIGADGVVRLRRKTEQPGDPRLEAAVARRRGRASRSMTSEEIMALTRGRPPQGRLAVGSPPPACSSTPTS